MAIEIENRITEFIPNLNISQQVLGKQLGDFIKAERERLKEQILNGDSGFIACDVHTRIWDLAIQKVYEVAVYQIQSEYTKQVEELLKIPGIDYDDLMSDVPDEWTPDLAVYAVGSYGRNELCFFFRCRCRIHIFC